MDCQAGTRRLRSNSPCPKALRIHVRDRTGFSSGSVDFAPALASQSRTSAAMAAVGVARDLLARFGKLNSGQQNLVILAGTVASIYLTKKVTETRRPRATEKPEVRALFPLLLGILLRNSGFLPARCRFLGLCYLSVFRVARQRFLFHFP